MHTTKILLTTATTLAVLLGGQALTAQAAKWHKGTPASLRGTYVSQKTGTTAASNTATTASTRCTSNLRAHRFIAFPTIIISIQRTRR